MKKLLFYTLLCISPISYGKIKQNVVICGVCKNVASRIPYSMKIMEKIGSLFKDYRIVVYENNSSDGTANLLKNWQKKNNKVRVLCENVHIGTLEKVIINRLQNGEFFRPECIARARNIVLNQVMSREYNKFDYVIWMDMDFKLEPSYEGFIDTFSSTRKWDAVFAYGIDPKKEYWDWYAFRDIRCPIGSELLGNYWWYLPKRLHLSSNGEWYPVFSAFGGCGIYKKTALKGCFYSALVNSDLAKFYEAIIRAYGANSEIKKYLQDCKSLNHSFITDASSNLANVKEDIGIKLPAVDKTIMWRMSSFVYKYPSVCEHVPLHAAMILRGHNKLFINPRLIFRYGD